MLKLMLILWYLLVGSLWLGIILINFSETQGYGKRVFKKKISLGDILISFFLTVFFLIIALAPNFIGAVIQWIVSLFH